MSPFAFALTLFHVLHAVVDGGLLLQLRGRPGALGLLRVVFGALAATALLALAIATLPGIHAFRFMALLSAGLFVHLPLALVGAALVLRPRSRAASRLALLGALPILVVAVEGFWIGPRSLELSRVRVQTTKLTEPVRIAVLADIQTDRVGEHERRAVRMAMAEEPDLVLLPGDYVQVGDPAERARVRRDLRRVFAEEGLAAPLGVFAVGGNTDSPGWEAVFEGLSVHAFHASGTRETGELRLTGLSMRDSFRPRLEIPATPEQFHVVLGHGPDFALGDVRADLLVAGHCHGGQVRLPFLGPPITLSKVPRDWTEGAHEIRPGTTLVVSRGIGMERSGAPGVRFLCRPEVVVIDVVPVPAP